MTRIIVAAAIIATVSTATDAAAFARNAQTRMSSAGAAPSQQQAGTPVTGKVVQTMDSGGYTYALVKMKEGKNVWVAVPQAKLTVGEVTAFRGGMEMTNFESKSLKRTFDKIIFSEGVAGGEKSKQEAKSPGSRGAVSKSDEKIKVEKATGPNAYTVADLYRLKAKLDKKKVVVRGKVMKVSSGIMGKNWIHLQDGSGSPKKGTNNLVVTSQAAPVVGEVVTASGVLYKGKDFGGGYKYEVIVEQGEIAVR